MLTLPIKKKWFDLIKTGIKKEEYRDIKPYYYSRLEKHLGKEIIVLLRNGYSRKSPTLKTKCFITKGFGKEKWGAEKNKLYYILEILEKGERDERIR